MKKNFLFLFLLIPAILIAQTEVTITDADITASSGSVNWTKNNIYLLDGFVYVEAPTVLNIEAGTVIKGLENPTTGDIASALIITRGAKIMAEGTALEPIIFTTEYDNTDLPDDGTDPDVDYKLDRGLWGGVVILGKAQLNVAAEKVVEGLPANEERAKYGGMDDADNSGVFKYVSIRYTGITVEANKELQGLTLGCVGSGTTIEYVESFNSDDDGFEFFGGTVNTKYLVSSFNSDDAFDYDQGFRGNHQFWFGIQSPTEGDHIGEWDGGDEGALTSEPLSKPVIYNATFLGRGVSASGSDAAIRIKEYGGVEFYNSIVADFGENGIEVDSGSGLTSYSRWQNGQVKFENNIWYKTGSDLSSYIPQQFMVGYLGNSANNNTLTDPQLKGLSRESNQLLDPRPAEGSPAYSLAKKAYPVGEFTDVDYLGAFGGDLWIANWTALAHNGILTNSVTSVEEKNNKVIPDEFSLSQNYPNPFNPSTKIQFSIPEASNVKLTVFNILGQKVAALLDGSRSAGTYTVDWNAENLTSGLYIYRLEAGNTIISKKMTLLK